MDYRFAAGGKSFYDGAMKPVARLFVNHPLRVGVIIPLEEMQSRYLGATLRVRPGQVVALFNGKDGEWNAAIADVGKKSVTLQVQRCTAEFQPAADIWLCFAPVKNEKIDYIAKRATELGVSCIQPVITQHTIVSRVNMERLRANVVEASEQSGRHDVPNVCEPVKLPELLARWEAGRPLIHCDESGAGQAVSVLLPTLEKGACAVLIGPEGGFSENERGILKKQPYIKPLSLGPRILRAETAVLAALANIQAWVGDWNTSPTGMQ